ncbi:alpha/beta fold hydrolase [Variovorax sp. M-6]|uniref:alpha/beta fold hydrolase n=1 Tax=Variovorax sp. M-6 TaxID=3233041 RepID=UPI003F9E3588
MIDISDFQVPFRDVVLHGSVTRGTSGSAPRTLALHGGGRSTRQGFQPLLTSLAERGHSCAAFDFSGHGESSGDLADSSLSHRAEQALAVVEHLRMRRPVSMIASSMGGHVACTLIDSLAPTALVLYCPAAYEQAAQNLAFGPAFRQVIRATTSFAASPAFDALERFSGRLLVVCGSEDSVIPKEVEREYVTRARKAKSVEVIRLAGAGHRLHDWLGTHPAQSAAVFERVLATLRGDA